ncbi:hypothetical protein J4P02_01385 [Pseudomonas sp. NFXW11]|uniref:hypothetical protein n=1 Tax=Pseudomonas sp. NFXW11 TaxID=2819531 RepID=UPI003CE7BAC4
MNVQALLRYLVRPSKQRSDLFFLILAAIVGGGAGLLVAEKISADIGIPFFFFSTLFLHFTWRTPMARGVDPHDRARVANIDRDGR